MPDYMVWPLSEDPRYVYVSKAYPLDGGTLLEADGPREAALAVRGELPRGVDRWVVLGPEGIVRIDFSGIEGVETLSLEPGAHR